jgi:hypothetical protein
VTWRNTERTGRRDLTRLSAIARKIAGVRHYDCDLYQTCPSCKRVQVFAEVKRYLVSDREWEQTRLFAEATGHKCVAILVVETLDATGVKVYNSETGEISGITWGGEEYLVKVLSRARDVHACW